MCAPSVPSALSEELRVAVLVPMDAMLTQLLSFQPFAESVLDPDHSELLLANYYNNFQGPLELWNIALTFPPKNIWLVHWKLIHQLTWSLKFLFCL